MLAPREGVLKKETPQVEAGPGISVSKLAISAVYQGKQGQAKAGRGKTARAKAGKGNADTASSIGYWSMG